MTLADCVALALKGNRSVQRAYLDRVAQQMDYRVARHQFAPQGLLGLVTSADGDRATDAGVTTHEDSVGVTITQALPTGGGFTLGWTGSSSHASEGENSDSAATWRLSFSQPLLRGGGTTAGTASLYLATLSEQGNVLSLQSSLMDVVTTAIVTFRSLILSERQVEIRRSALARGRQLVEINKELIAAGRMAEMEQVQAEADIANLELSVLTAENDFDTAQLNLLQFLTLDKGMRIRPEENLDEGPAPPTLEAALDLAFASRPDYLQAELSLQAAERNAAVARNNTLVDLNLELSASRSLTGEHWSDVTSSELWDTSRASWLGALSLGIPINDPSRKQALVRARVSLEQSRLSLEDRRDALETDVRNALRTAEMARRQLAIARQGRVLSEKKLEVEQEKLRTGRSSNFQIVNFQNDLVNAQTTEISAIIGYRNALAYLDRALGTTLKTWGIEVRAADTRPPVPRPAPTP